MGWTQACVRLSVILDTCLVLQWGTIHDWRQGLGLNPLSTSELVINSKHGPVQDFWLGMVPSWVCPVLTSRPSCLVGEAWEPSIGEKGLCGLVRLTELMGLAGVLALKEPGTSLSTMQGEKSGGGYRDRVIRIHMIKTLVFPVNMWLFSSFSVLPLWLAMSVPLDELFLCSPSNTSCTLQNSFWMCLRTSSLWKKPGQSK